MVTPLLPDRSLDLDGAAKLAAGLLERGHDGLVLNGTTGEAPTTSPEEKAAVVRAVRAAVGPDVPLLSGAGSYDTAASVRLAREAAAAGADGLLLVSPYYSKPTQAGLVAHVEAVADATELPIMLYDIPGRTAVPFATETLRRLAEHPRVVAVKDAKDDLALSSEVLAQTDLAYYSGTDALNLPLLAVGGVGVVSVISHLVGERVRDMVAAFEAGEVGRARELHLGLAPVAAAVFRLPGVVTTKAALARAGLPAGPVRLPLVEATEEQVTTLTRELAAAGVAL
ncbi:MAG: 4-hydroxy-tetrahydrodipicolinate synthase [Actinomycetota bacterium]|nr:4-hydroxy-tetrahydrodipicolinate synthase [Actinomycetota bacterium]